MEYRIPLEDGNVLVLTLEIEEREAVDADPASIGEALLGLLGVGRTKAVKSGRPAPTAKHVRPKTLADDDNPDRWLRKTSEESLGVRFKANTRADGDPGD